MGFTCVNQELKKGAEHKSSNCFLKFFLNMDTVGPVCALIFFNQSPLGYSDDFFESLYEILIARNDCYSH